LRRLPKLHTHRWHSPATVVWRERWFRIQVIRTNLKRGTVMKTLATIAVASMLVLAQASGIQAQSPPSGPGSASGGAPSAASPNQVPSGGTIQSTTPPVNTGPAATSSSGTVGQSGRSIQPQEPSNLLQDPKEDPIVRESEHEVSRRIKSICKGC
jgi:hypothetical protein